MKTKAWPCQTHWKLLAILHFAWVQDPYFFCFCTWSLYLEVKDCRQLICQIEAVFKIDAALETASSCRLTSLAPLSLHLDKIFSQARTIRWREKLILAMNRYDPLIYMFRTSFLLHVQPTWAERAVEWIHHFLCQLLLLLNFKHAQFFALNWNLLS